MAVFSVFFFPQGGYEKIKLERIYKQGSEAPPSWMSIQNQWGEKKRDDVKDNFKGQFCHFLLQFLFAQFPLMSKFVIICPFYSSFWMSEVTPNDCLRKQAVLIYIMYEVKCLFVFLTCQRELCLVFWHVGLHPSRSVCLCTDTEKESHQ